MAAIPPPPPRPAASLLRDLALVAAHVHTLPALLGLPRWHRREKHQYPRPRSELDVFAYAPEFARIVGAALVTAPFCALGLAGLAAALLVERLGGGRRMLDLALAAWAWVLSVAAGRASSAPEQPRTFVSVGADGVEEVCYYVNGIVEQGRMLEASAEVLEALTGRAFNLMVNPSDGLWLDLAECVFGRTLDIASPVVAQLADAVETQLVDRKRRVVVVAHSQGGIILSNVMRGLMDRAREPDGSALAEALPQLEVFSFCSAADEFAGAGTVFAEHFVAEMDFVARIGVLHFSGKLAELDPERSTRPPEADEWNGDVFVLRRDLPGQGHLLKEFLLPIFVAGPFGRASRFYRRYFKESPQWRAISHVIVER